jgi:hypothetical protein
MTFWLVNFKRRFGVSYCLLFIVKQCRKRSFLIFENCLALNSSNLKYYVWKILLASFQGHSHCKFISEELNFNFWIWYQIWLKQEEVQVWLKVVVRKLSCWTETTPAFWVLGRCVYYFQRPTAVRSQPPPPPQIVTPLKPSFHNINIPEVHTNSSSSGYKTIPCWQAVVGTSCDLCLTACLCRVSCVGHSWLSTTDLKSWLLYLCR